MDDKNIIAIEIGSSKIKGALGSVDHDGTLTVKAIEEVKLTDAVRYGQLGNVVQASSAMRNILQKIENRVAPRKVRAVYVGVGGRSLSTVERRVERRMGMSTEVTPELTASLKAEARRPPLPDREILAVEQREFLIDGRHENNPLGNYATDVTLVANLITCRPQLKNNLPRLFEEKLQLKVGGYIVRHTAIADLVLAPRERKLGCMLVDFGAETVTVSLYRDDSLLYLATLPMGSRNLTRDISSSLSMLEDNAEEIKHSHGTAVNPTADTSTMDMRLAEVASITSARAVEIIKNIQKQLEYAGLSRTAKEEIPAGVVIVGGGSKLTGFNARLEQTLGVPVRVGMASGIRLADTRIALTDSVDVIATLQRAAAMADLEDCLTELPKAPEPEITEEPEPEQPVRKSGGLRGFFSKAKTFLIDPPEPGGDGEGNFEEDADA